MPDSGRKGAPGSRTVTVGKSAIGSAIVLGDDNRVEVHYEQVNLPRPEAVDLRTELAAIQEVLTKIETEDRRRIERAMEEAYEEAERPAPRKDVIGESLEKALRIANEAGALADVAAKLRPHVAGLTAWLGEAWHKLLPLVRGVL
ncbi:hypothetical protein [Sorangium sp. So ce861]|uniref:hypothetical protein n=1 Tax=Sorangium sp. So ce861 TaxID=3133323 RepID=UPI003F62C5AC